jgi:hypothetical protein
MGFPLISNLWHWQDSFVQQNASFSEYENFATEPRKVLQPNLLCILLYFHLNLIFYNIQASIMTIKPLLILLFLALTGCGSAPKKPMQPEAQPKAQESQPSVDHSKPLRVGSRKYKIVQTAINEWVYFGQQKVVIDVNEESIPHVGIWEDDDYSHSDRINQYWRAVGKYQLSGNDCKAPWSAAFISWIMQTAGVPEYLFPPASAHHSYLNHLLANAHNPYATLIPHTIQEYKPKPGDLICANRGKDTPIKVSEGLPDSLNSRLHCDIVVETKDQTLQAIGGNVRNSVSKTILTLSSDGYLQFTKSRLWFLIIENRLDR